MRSSAGVGHVRARLIGHDVGARHDAIGVGCGVDRHAAAVSPQAAPATLNATKVHFNVFMMTALSALRRKRHSAAPVSQPACQERCARRFVAIATRRNARARVRDAE